MRLHVVLLCSFPLAAPVELVAQVLPIKAYATSEGIAHNSVNRIVKDSRGFLWFCTAGGLSRFDGYAFANFSTEQGLPNSSVNDLLETRAGEYWVATDGGLVRFDPRGRATRRVVYDSEAVAPKSMFTVIKFADPEAATRSVTVLVEGKDGTIWAGTDSGLYRLEPANGRQLLRPVDVHIPNAFPEQRIIADIVEDAHGSLWIAAPSGLYRRWPDGSAARYTKRDGLPGEYLSDLLEDHEGHLWAGTRLSGFFRFNADRSHRAPVVDLKFDYNPHQNNLPTSWVYQLFETFDHRFWIATANGLVEFFPRTSEQGEQGRFRSYTETNGLTDYNITSLNEDDGGNLWLGTISSGAMKLTRGGFESYGKQDGIGPINDIFEDRASNLCFKGSVLGNAQPNILEGNTRLGCFDGKRFDWFKPRGISDRGWRSSWVMEQVTLQAHNGDWWIGTSEGLYHFPRSDSFATLKTARPLALYTKKDGLATPQVFRLFEDSHANIWISTIAPDTNGLARWDPLNQKISDLTYATGLPSFKEDRPRSFAEDHSGNLWIGFNSGLVRYERGKFELFRERDGLPRGRIMKIYVDHSGRLWLASDAAGLIRVDNLAATKPTFVSYTTAQGLSSNNNEVITEDLNGHIYVGGGRGLDQLDPSTGHVKHFTTTDGLPRGNFRTGFRDHAGALWFGMTSGLAQLVPATQKPPEAAPILITGVNVSGTREPISAVGERDIAFPDFAPDKNQLQIDFVALGFRPGDVLRYQYKLDGTDATWSALDAQRTVTYASLGPGRYRFLVRAMNSEGILSAHPASIAFTILSPLWLRRWFLTSAALALGLVAYALYRYRLTRVLEMANMRTRIATDLHDDIGANLTRIALLSELANQTRDADRLNTDAPLASITRIARESVGSMSDIVWAINPERESLLDLTRRMRQHADEIFTLRDIELRFNAPVASESLRLGVDVRRDVLLIFKEAVSNAARHSRCSRVDIDLRVEGSRLKLGVKDDGVGFDTSLESEGQGMTSMQRRAHSLNGTIDIKSMKGSGTAVKLDIPK